MIILGRNCMENKIVSLQMLFLSELLNRGAIDQALYDAASKKILEKSKSVQSLSVKEDYGARDEIEL